MGSPRGTAELELHNQLHRKAVFLIGAHARTSPAKPSLYAPWTRLANWELALQYVAQGQLRVEGVVTHVPAAPGIYEGLADHRERYVGVLLDWRD